MCNMQVPLQSHKNPSMNPCVGYILQKCPEWMEDHLKNIRLFAILSKSVSAEIVLKLLFC